MEIDFDESCLDYLNIEETLSLLKSNVISWNIRSKIIDILGHKVAVNLIESSLPMIITTALVSSLYNIIERMVKKKWK